MTKLLQLTSILSICVFCAHCSKKTDSNEPMQPLPNYHPIVGQWDWQYSQYPFSSDSVIASPDSLQSTLDFRINDTVYEENFYQGVLLPSASKAIHYEIITHFDGQDSVPAIKLDGIRWGFAIFSNQLLIDMSRNDGGLHYYSRN